MTQLGWVVADSLCEVVKVAVWRRKGVRTPDTPARRNQHEVPTTMGRLMHQGRAMQASRERLAVWMYDESRSTLEGGEHRLTGAEPIPIVTTAPSHRATRSCSSYTVRCRELLLPYGARPTTHRHITDYACSVVSDVNGEAHAVSAYMNRTSK